MDCALGLFLELSTIYWYLIISLIETLLDILSFFFQFEI